MTTPKSAEEIIAMWPYKMSDAEMFCLRIALASHTAYLLGKWPELDAHWKYAHVNHCEACAFDRGIIACGAILEAEITELTK